jgi:phosphoribosyl-ATP pyrophosphohydrolase
MTKFTLHDLEKRVATRAKASPAVSYTRQLLDRGVAQCAKKLGEEAIETGLAAVGENRKRVTSEAADLMYHLLVLLRARKIALKEVEAALAKRLSQSGLAEKASRKKKRPKSSNKSRNTKSRKKPRKRARA